MATAHFAKLIERLLAKFCSWEGALGVQAASAPGGLSPTARETMRLELERLRDTYAAPAGRAKSSLSSLFSRWREPPIRDLASRERLLLREYERLCDLDLPLRISGVLLRHYSALKRASHAQPSVHTPILALPSVLGPGVRA